MDKETCRWIYRPGTNNSHWAMTTCKKGFNYLSRLDDSEPYVGVADWYNGRLCPICNKPIKMDYIIIKKEEEPTIIEADKESEEI